MASPSVPVPAGEYVPTADQRLVTYGVPWAHYETQLALRGARAGCGVRGAASPVPARAASRPRGKRGHDRGQRRHLHADDPDEVPAATGYRRIGSVLRLLESAADRRTPGTCNARRASR